MSLPLPMVTGYLAPQEISRMKRRGRLHHTRRRAMSGSRPVWFLDFQNRLRRMYTEASNLMLVKNAQHSGSLGQWSTGIVQESRWSSRCWLGFFACWAPELASLGNRFHWDSVRITMVTTLLSGGRYLLGTCRAWLLSAHLDNKNP